MSDNQEDPLSWPAADEQQEEIEDLITHLDEPLGSEGRTTAAEQREGVTIDEALERERPDVDLGEPKTVDVLVELDEPDHEPELVGDASEQFDSWVSPEEA